MDKKSFELEKFQAAHFGNMISVQASLNKDSLKPTNRFTKAKHGAQTIRKSVQDLIDFEILVTDKVKEFKKPFTDIDSELKEKLNKEGISDEEKAEIQKEIEENLKVGTAKLEESFKGDNDKYNALSKEKVTIVLSDVEFDAVKNIFDLYANDRFPSGQDEKGETVYTTYGEDFVLAWCDALEAAKKAE